MASTRLATRFQSQENCKKHERIISREEPVSANPGINVNPGFYLNSYCSKAFSQIIFSILYRTSDDQIVDKRISMNLLFKLSYLNSNSR